MDIFNIKLKILLQFLKINNIYTNYKNNTNNNITNVLINVNLCSAISCGFTVKGWKWSDVIEGRAYWNAIHIKYILFLCEKYTNKNNKLLVEYIKTEEGKVFVTRIVNALSDCLCFQEGATKESIEELKKYQDILKQN